MILCFLRRKGDRNIYFVEESMKVVTVDMIIAAVNNNKKQHCITWYSPLHCHQHFNINDNDNTTNNSNADHNDDNSNHDYEHNNYKHNVLGGNSQKPEIKK